MIRNSVFLAFVIRQSAQMSVEGFSRRVFTDFGFELFKIFDLFKLKQFVCVNVDSGCVTQPFAFVLHIFYCKQKKFYTKL